MMSLTFALQRQGYYGAMLRKPEKWGGLGWKYGAKPLRSEDRQILMKLLARGPPELLASEISRVALDEVDKEAREFMKIFDAMHDEVLSMGDFVLRVSNFMQAPPELNQMREFGTWRTTRPKAVGEVWRRSVNYFNDDERLRPYCSWGELENRVQSLTLGVVHRNHVGTCLELPADEIRTAFLYRG